jgi:hypothetical protein
MTVMFSQTHPMKTTVRVSAAASLALLAGAASADTIVGDLTWTAGSSIDVTEDLLIEGTLTVEAGVAVSIANGAEIRVKPGGFLLVEASRGDPATFLPAARAAGTGSSSRRARTVS